MNKHQKDPAGKIKNRIALYRRRMGFSQRRVAALLGYGDSSTLSVHESGRSMPSLAIAFSLAIVLRIPVEFLYPDLYDSLRDRIRAQEELSSQRKRNRHSSHSPT